MTSKKRGTVDLVFNESSPLREAIRKGLGALESGHRSYVDGPIRTAFDESVDIDAALKSEAPTDNRWDYLLGHDESSEVVGLEPHSANTKEISVVIAKKKAALDQLRPHLKSGKRVARWFWVASGKTSFLPHEKCVLQIQQAGIDFVGRSLKEKNLKGLAKSGGKKGA